MKFSELKKSVEHHPDGLSEKEELAWRCMNYLNALYQFKHIDAKQVKQELAEIEYLFMHSLTPHEKVMIVMLKELFEHVSFQDFQKVALPLHRDTECCLHALLDGNFPPCLSPMQDIDEMAGHVSRPHPDPFIDALFRLHFTLKGMYLEGNLNEYRPL